MGSSARAADSSDLTEEAPRDGRDALLLWVRVGLVALAALALYLQLDLGRADNGDFTRVMTWFVDSPVGFEENFPTDPDDRQLRFFTQYLPYWDLTFPLDSAVTSSAVLLWLPGVALNWALYSPEVLSLAVMSLPARLILLGALLLLFTWLDRRLRDPRERLIATLAIGVPFLLLLTATDYVTFLNSFYQEAASFVYLVAFLAVVLALRLRGWSRGLAGFALMLLFLVAATKASNVYWPFIGIAALVPPAAAWRPRLIAWAVALVVAAILAYAALALTMGANIQSTLTYHSIFNGVLPLSDQPDEHLEELGMADADECIGHSAFDEVGGICWRDRKDDVSRADLVGIVARELILVPRALTSAASAMQDLTFPSARVRAEEPPQAESRTPLLNSWSLAKRAIFPRGGLLIVTLLAYLAASVWALRAGGLRGDLGALGLMLTLATGVDMAVAFFGDGFQELDKHLFVANLTFDLATVALVGLLTTVALARRKSRASTQYVGEPE